MAKLDEARSFRQVKHMNWSPKFEGNLWFDDTVDGPAKSQSPVDGW